MTEAAYLEKIRIAYDTVAISYEKLLRDSLASTPLDRAMLTTFAELVRASGGSQVLEVGCGPGRITTFLDSLGLDVRGVDLSPAMVAVARERFPRLQFDIGTMTALNHPDETFDGLVSWFSIIHLPTDLVPKALAEFRRVLRPGGLVAMTFQVGAEIRHIQHAYDHDIDIESFRRMPEVVIELLADAGFEIYIQVRKEREADQISPQSILIARAL